ncbi:MAG: acetyl-CoA carboxylase biotin carboxyl carrier protein [Epsilonproteobacteria bacterium]|nr:acetyl-CoA carboxylase biotin carboxyl carrier protein [Campylobacterota bacterium]
MTFDEIKELMEIFGNSELSKIMIKDGDFEIELDKTAPLAKPQPIEVAAIPSTEPQPQAQPSPQSPTTNVDEEFITSPMVGTFYQAPAPTEPPYVKVGDKVKAGQTVCIVEAMKIMNEIPAEFDCEILEILVKDGQAVEFDTPLFRVKRV